MKTDDRFFRYVRGFLTIYLPKNKCYGSNTVKSYRDTLNLFRRFLWEEKQLPFSKITFDLLNKDVLDEFMTWLQTDRGCTASTRNQRLAALKSFLYYCALEDLALMDIYRQAQKVPSKKVIRNRVKYLSETALKNLLEQPDISTRHGLRNQFMMILMYDTAARIDEILELTLNDLHLNDPIPCVDLTGKGEKMRVVPLMDKTIAHLSVYMKIYHPEEDREKTPYLFYTVSKKQKGKMSVDNVASFLKGYASSAHQVCPEVPLDVHPHLFRHTRAMHLYQAGVPLSYIKDFLGHANINTTSIYAETDLSMMQEALEKIDTGDGKHPSIEEPIWKDNAELILKLCGLK